MREIDQRTRVSRRVFLRSSATAVPAAAALAAGVSISAEAAWAQEAKALTPHTMATLVRVARDTYPHDRLADLYYVKAVTPYDAKAGGDAAFRELLESGVGRLDADAAAAHGGKYIDVAWEEQRVAILRANEHTPFFKKLRSDLIVTLYNQKEVWPKFGYEGSSADKGGYIHRGFNDIDWLSSV
jgi:hypothetical protein